MTKKDLGVMLRLGLWAVFFAAASAAIAVGVTLLLVLSSFGESPWLRYASVRFVLNPFVVAAVFGLIGLWVGRKRVPDSQKMIYPATLVFVLLYLGVLVQILKIRTTPQATARAVLKTWGHRGDGLVLGPSSRISHSQSLQFDLKRGDEVIGYVGVAPFAGFLWQSGGSMTSEFTPDK